MMGSRRQDVDDEGDDLPVRTAPKRSRRAKRRFRLLFFIGVGLLLFLAAAPTVATSRSILLPLIDRYAGIAPLKIDFTRVHAGWLTPLSVEGLRIQDEQGQDVAKVGSIQTQKSLLSWILASSSLGTIIIRDVDVDVAVSQGTTSVEQALAPLLDAPADAASQTTTHYTGALELANARIALRDARHSDVWLLTIPTFKTQLPGAQQVIGPTQLAATLSQAGGLESTNNTQGKIAADVVESMVGDVRTFNVRAVVDQVPLAFWHVLHERMPELPIEELAGTLSARVAGSLVDGDRWNFNVEQLSGDQLVVTAPAILGAKPAAMQSVRLQGQAALAGGSLALQGAQLMTDVGGMSARGTLPWPLVTPTLTSPWMAGAQLEANGEVDLAKLVKVAETLVPMREDTKLLSGVASFKASQQLNAGGQPSSMLEVQLGKLVAVAAGQQLKWDDALKLALSAQPNASGAASLAGTCDAEFCKVTVSGTAADGSFKGQVDLDRLQQRLSQWVQLPISNMAGQAGVQMRWNQSEPGIVSAEGQLETTPLVVQIAGGGQLNEPAWKGNFTAAARLVGTQLTSIQRGHMELVAQNEKLNFDLLEPLSLATTGTLTPAAFTVSAEGGLELWQKRAVMLKLIDRSTTLAGTYTLGASGRMDLSHLELRQANWRSQPFEVGASGASLIEPEMIGNFQGLVNTGDLSQLAIEKLVVQAHSFSLSAADKAVAGPEAGREGTGAYIIDVGTLMKHVQSAPSSSSTAAAGGKLVLPPGALVPPSSPDSQLTFSGQVQGNLRWQVNAKKAQLEMDAKSDQVDVMQPSASGPPTRLWSEAQIVAALKSVYDMASGNVQVDSMQLQTPWMHYAGNARIDNGQSEQVIRASGQCIYDAGSVAAKLQPYIGNNMQMSGRKQVPVEVVWKTGGPATTTSTLAGLEAATRIGWEQARVVGIEVGPADVPVSVTKGQLATSAEIPVSGGTLRWDMQSDLTAPQTVLIQKPMTVLENVAITPQMCQSWLKYVTPLIAEATSVDGRLSLKLNEARFNVANPADQIVDGQLIIHSAAVGPGPLSNQVIGLVQQINAIRKRELAATVSSPQVWMQMPQQAIAFRMENGRVMHRDLRFNVGDVTLVSSGAVGIDGRMELNAAMPIPDDWVEKSPYLASLRGQTLQFPIRGSLSAPQLDAQFLKDFGRQAVTQAAEGLLQQQLQRGLGKLFPGGAAAPAPAPQAGAVPGGAAAPTGTGTGFGLPQLPQLGLPQFGLPQFGLPQQTPAVAPSPASGGPTGAP